MSFSCKRCGVPLRKKDKFETEDYCGFCSRKFNILSTEEYQHWVLGRPLARTTWISKAVPIDFSETYYDMEKYDILDRMVRAGDVILYPLDEIQNNATEKNNNIIA